MIDTFISRPTWTPPVIEDKLLQFYTLIEDVGFKPHTIGKEHIPLRSPFDDIQRLMRKCECTIVLGLPQIFMNTGSIKHIPFEGSLRLPTEWNQIEATMSLMLQLPTLVLLHKTVASRGLFDRGAANIFIHEFDTMEMGWIDKLRAPLNSLKQECRI